MENVYTIFFHIRKCNGDEQFPTEVFLRTGWCTFAPRAVAGNYDLRDISLFSAPLTVEGDLYTVHTLHYSQAYLMLCVCRPGSWMHLGEGMSSCHASDVMTQEQGGDERKVQ